MKGNEKKLKDPRTTKLDTNSNQRFKTMINLKKKYQLTTQATMDNLSEDFTTVFYNLCFLVCLRTAFGKP